MRILYLADIRFPLERANGIQTMHTCHALAARGHRIALGVRPDVRRPPRDPFSFYGLPCCDRLRVVRARVQGPEPVRRLCYLGFCLLHARRSAYDLVFTRDLTVAASILRLPWSARAPVVYESHGFAPVFTTTMNELVTGAIPGGRMKQRRLLRRERGVWRRAEGYVTTTGVLADEMSERFGPRSMLLTAPNGARMRPGAPFAFPAPPTTPVIAYAGHLYPWKGVDIFLRALTRLGEARGLVIGGHPREGDLDRARKLAHELDLSRRVTFAGPTEVAGVAPLLDAAHVLVLPTTGTPSARYTSPLKLFEYMAAGRPIVASDLPPVREVLEDGVTGCLVPPGDFEALAAGIDRVLRNRGLAERIANAALEQAPAYSWERRAERLEELCEEVVRRDRARRRGMRDL